jgi:hypothetical protein
VGKSGGALPWNVHFIESSKSIGFYFLAEALKPQIVLSLKNVMSENLSSL